MKMKMTKTEVKEILKEIEAIDDESRFWEILNAVYENHRVVISDTPDGFEICVSEFIKLEVYYFMGAYRRTRFGPSGGPEYAFFDDQKKAEAIFDRVMIKLLDIAA